MEIKGTLKLLLPSVTGQSSKGNWTKQEIIITTDETYPKDVCITFWGDIVQKIQQVPEGSKLTVSINVESREYNSKWFTEVKAWKFNVDSKAEQQSVKSENYDKQVGNKEPEPITKNGEDDDFNLF